MLKITEIGEQNINLLKEFAPSLLNVINVIIGPHIMQVGDVTYAVCKEGPVIAVSEKIKDDEYMSYAVLMDETGEKLERVVDEYALLEIFLDNDIPIVSKTDLTGEMQQQFFVTWAQENQPHDWMHYYASNKENTAEMEYQYDITQMKSYLASYLTYIGYKYPDLITFKYDSKLFGLINKRKTDTYFRLEDGQNYGKMMFEFGSQLAVLGTQKFSFEEIKSMMREMGIEVDVPVDMVDTFAGRNEKVKTLELIGREYNKLSR